MPTIPVLHGRCEVQRLLAFVAIVASSLAFAPRVLAQEHPDATDTLRVPESVTNFLEQNCTTCHSEDFSEGDLDLESLTLKLHDPDNFHLWEYAFDRVRGGEMPPDESIDEDEKQAFLGSLKKILSEADAKKISQRGRVPARRLTRAQYERSVHSLLKTNIPLREILPADSISDGFDTVSRSQQISNHLMSAYLKSADAALDAAFQTAMSGDQPYKVRLDWTQLQRNEAKPNREPEGRPEHQDIVSWSTRQNFYGRMHATTVPMSGLFRIRVHIQAVNAPKDGHVWCSLRSGACSGKETELFWIAGFEATDTPVEREFTAWIRKGHQLQLRPNDSGLKKARVQGKNSVRGPSGRIQKTGVPGVAIKWIEIEKINPAADDARRVLFGDLGFSEASEAATGRHEIVSADPKGDLQKLIGDFAERAFRKPMKNDELLPYFDFAHKTLEETNSFTSALQASYRAILCSSRFLYLDEPSNILNDHALATRLSYFLWGLPPDDQLRELADSGRLSDSETLRRETERLLADTRSETFVHEFTDQWLMLHELNETTPDGRLYPEYDDVLHHSLRQESHAFVRALVENNLPASNIIDSDFTYLNSRLARHYRINWPGGNGLKRVALRPEDRRGGVITHASVLKVTANGTTTSPIIRGVWMLERIMGQHVPPPPENVPAVEPDIRGATTIRDQLDKHRNIEECAACHVKIDPPGFALESFDVIGGFREKYRAAGKGKNKRWVEGLPVDPSYTLPTGEDFKDLYEFKKILASNPKKLARSLASQLVTYATGAPPGFSDRDKLSKIVDKAAESNFGVRSLIHEVIQSQIFRNK